MRFSLIPLVIFIVNINLSSQNISRTEIINRAEMLTKYEWICSAENRTPSCDLDVIYYCDFNVGELVKGLPYDWGGMDSITSFSTKMNNGFAAGSHLKHGDKPCTAGTDCSGFVSYCWGQSKKRSTRDIHQISSNLNSYSQLKAGDALNKKNKHIVLFVGRQKNGRPIVYESSGTANRVILNTKRTWKSLEGYKPLRYLGTK